MTSPKLQQTPNNLLELEGSIEPANLSEMIILGEEISEDIQDLILIDTSKC